jgi:methionine synthase II (cobalamin-independent)
VKGGTDSVARMALPPECLGGASGVGSMPGEDPAEAAAIVAHELGEPPGLPALPELPWRGPGADLVGRTAGLLTELPVDREPSGWRLTARPGRDVHRARSYLAHDLDAFEEAMSGHDGPVKIALAGPWTLAAALQLPRGEPVLADEGARRDVGQALAEAAAQHVADLARRLSGPVVLQLDEPSLPWVLLGRVPSFSGARTINAVPEHDAIALLRQLVEAVGVPVVVHCCAADPPVRLFHDAGAAGVSIDLTLVGPELDDALGEALEAGVALLAGVVPSTDEELSDPAATVAPVRRLWSRLGLDSSVVPAPLVTPTCGLAGASPGRARRALALAREAARTLVDDI